MFGGILLPKLKQNSRKSTWLSLLGLVAACLALNNLGIFFNGALGLPFYLDNIGTILAALLGGYIPCITVGFLTNLVAAITNPDSIYYCIISVFIAVAAVAFVRKLRLIRFPHVIWAVLTFAFIGGVVGGMLTCFIYGMNFGEGVAVDFAASIDKTVPMGYFFSNLLSVFLIDIVDKTIVTALSLLIYKLLPHKLIGYLGRQDWYLVRIFEESNRKIRGRMSLRHKSTLLVAVSTTLVAASAIGIAVVQYHHTTISEYTYNAEYAASVIANSIDPDRIESFLRDGERAPDYIAAESVLQTVSDASPEIQFIYVYQIREDGTHVVFDLNTKDVEGDDPGQVIEYDDTIKKYSKLFMEGKDIPVDITNDENGWLLSVYKPVKDKNGNALCYVGVDISMSHLHADEVSFIAKVISIFLGVLILIRTYAAWMSERHIVRPVNVIADAANHFVYDTPQSREESLKMIDELGICTGDEIEYLYDAYKRTTSDTVRYINEVEEKSEQIVRLQNGLVFVLANMVESRDKCTGDHVLKTALYCEIILRQMKKDGIYAEELTDEFISEVIHSAPLHDIGKIKVSDTILNKPGKLTDEEFKIMQSHTTAGGEIIDKVVDTVGKESEYLTEAKNLATYHHEKWNGKGYPKGLKGKEIPLSARIMAVADVFDALVSRRSYKEPFSVDEAFEIIRRDSGTHFDPLIVQAFLNDEEEVRRVQELNMEL